MNPDLTAAFRERVERDRDVFDRHIGPREAEHELWAEWRSSLEAKEAVLEALVVRDRQLEEARELLGFIASMDESWPAHDVARAGARAWLVRLDEQEKPA